MLAFGGGRACFQGTWMPIFFKGDQKILFVHIPKTGGTYIERMFEKNGFKHDFWMLPEDRHLLGVMHCSPQHLHWSQLRALFAIRKFSYMFTVVREPLSRFISEYRMRSQSKGVEFNAWAVQALDRHQKRPYSSDNHLRPQVEFVGENVDVFKFEDGLGSDWVARLQSRLGPACAPLTAPPPPRKGPRHPVEPSPEVVERVQLLYAEDYQRFGYPLVARPE